MPVQLAALLPGVEAVAGQLDLELPLGLAALPLLLVPVGQGAGVAVAAVPATVGLAGEVTGGQFRGFGPNSFCQKNL